MLLHPEPPEHRQKLLLVASTGGHLWQLSKLAPRLGAAPDTLWVTFDSAQSRSLLANRRVHYLPYVAPRDWKGAVSAVRSIRKLVLEESFMGLFSTGAAVGLSAMLAARGVIKDRLYIESVSRFDGPSLTGRMIRSLRLADTITQHRSWSSRGWRYEGSVLEQFRPVQKPPRPVRRVFVTLGTIQPYEFRRLAQRLAQEIPAGVEVVWQLGETPGDDLPGEVHSYLSASQFMEAVRQADVVVSHAGVGTLLGLLEAGVFPVAVPRDPAWREHVDAHQFQAAQALDAMGLVMCRMADELSWPDLQHATETTIAPMGDG